MQIITKRIRVIQMTDEEMRKFQEAMERARVGHTSHYAEEQLADGTFLGVQVLSDREAAQSAQAAQSKGKRERLAPPQAY